ncbi:hypothetical protein ACOSP7_013993 [Xanthoceras sorbifolium]
MSLIHIVIEANHSIIRMMSADERSAKQCRTIAKGVTVTDADMRGVHWLINDAIVIKATIEGVTIYRTMIDNSSPVNVLYKAAFEEMGLKQSHLRPLSEPLYGFTVDSIIP